MRRFVDSRHGIEFERPWFYEQGKKFGFLMTSDDGKKFVVCHRRRIHKFNKEYGFYSPAYFIANKARLLFELNTKKGYVHYIFDPAKGTRMILTYPHVFLSINRMEIESPAVHIKRIRNAK